MTNRARDSRTIRRERAVEMSRHHFLRGMGACIALPSLVSLLPRGAAAAANPLATTASGMPLRTAFVYIPNGAVQTHWWPEGGEKDFQLNETMKPLEDLREQIQILGGMDQLNSTAGPDGAGDHARANATFLTGMRARKTSGSNIHVGVSIDQVIAQHVGHLSRFPSLELSCDAVRKSGSCDSGYSCAYQYNISWRTPTTPMAPETNPRLVFERLFGGDGKERLNVAQRASILDFVLEDARALERRLAKQDQGKLDEYLSSVREIERRIEHMESFGMPEKPEGDAPEGIPGDYAEHIDVMFEMLALAFQTDSTRVATLLLAHDGSNRSFPEIGVREGHHYLSHQLEDAEPREKVSKIDQFYTASFAKFLRRLSDTKDADGTSILDNSMIVYGSGIADANRHTHHSLPCILAGGGGGQLHPGRYVKHKNQPMSNLFLGLTDAIGIEGIEHFGDADGRVHDI